ncbi:MAG: hypothetical protein OEM82_11800 [Acidobacteriota bacterium]|nr:hypothetical protein [Acidobacteriota bacterium]MDH3530966.1 hypothetical protein [Acidobacteriota bacterium]
MPNGDPMITPAEIQKNQPIPVISDSTINQKAQKPNKFLNILGGLAGGALNMVAPGIGSLIGGAIGGSGSAFGSYGSLIDQQRQFEKMQRYNQVSNMMQQQQNQAMMDQQRKQSYKLIEMQNRVSMQAQEFSTVSNLLKSRHDSEMNAVNNIKS